MHTRTEDWHDVALRQPECVRTRLASTHSLPRGQGIVVVLCVHPAVGLQAPLTVTRSSCVRLPLGTHVTLLASAQFSVLEGVVAGPQ